jgi:hypothetical protein
LTVSRGVDRLGGWLERDTAGQADPPWAQTEPEGDRRRLQVEYDEDRELTRYVWDHSGLLMTPFERQVGRAILGRARAASQSPVMAGMLNRHWGAAGDAEVEAALADGPEPFRRHVRDRLLSERAAEVFVNRCPKCERVVRTPQARQCFWCGFDWHSAV